MNKIIKNDFFRLIKYSLVFLLLITSYTSSFAKESLNNNIIVGAGAHFSWLIFNELQDEMEQISGKKLNLYGQGSMLGVGCKAGIKTALKNKPGAETFGFVCCPLSNEEIEKKEIVLHPIAKEPILTLVNDQNPVKDLSKEQVQAIFKGEINNWKEVGGFDKPIIVVGRLHCKKRPGHWKTILPSHKLFTDDRLNVTSAEEMVGKISSLPNAIGHIGSAWKFKSTDEVKSLTVNGHRPTAKNIKSGTYPFFRQLSAVTNMSPSKELIKIIQHAQKSESFLKIANKYELLPL